MDHPLFNTARLSRTANGEVRFALDGSQQYWFMFRQLDRCLSADEFHRFHHAVMAHLGMVGPVSPSSGLVCQRGPATVMQPLPTCLNRADIREIRTLLGMATLMVCTLSKAYNELN